ncbi:hypothetical protein Dda_0718 [Drechslerella dactyloides]|uniref:NADH dehydrogenase [ubiquinone] 1 alpha subcomplex assembly factor 3 n=1 Tax=Drechslerella dactyloides TaxID=74499 RepID=A0AAD6J852_DREDA|nr:hypothetical protein Dda_0718 [Drechslerella dactyloides]
MVKHDDGAGEQNVTRRHTQLFIYRTAPSRMPALHELAGVARPLSQLVNPRIGAYSHGIHARRFHLQPSYLLQLRRYLPRHSRLPDAAAAAAGTGYQSSRHFRSSAIAFDPKSSSSSSQEPPTKIGPKEGGNDPNEIFTDMNVLSGVPPPASAIETVYADGFLLNNGMRFHGKDGIVIVHNEAFNWLTNGAARIRNGVLELDDELWGVLDVVAPKPELLILGTGARSLQISAKAKDYLHDLGIRIDSMDTNHAASSYNLLATERPGQIIAAALLPASFR